MPHPCFAPLQPAGFQREGRTFPALPEEVQFLIVHVAKEDGRDIRVSEMRHKSFDVTVWGAVEGLRTYVRSINNEELRDRLRNESANACGAGAVR